MGSLESASFLGERSSDGAHEKTGTKPVLIAAQSAATW